MSVVRLDGQVALVTGGTRGIGRTIAERLLSAGATVYVCARRPPDAPVTHADVSARFLAADVRDSDQVQAIFRVIDEEQGRLDLLINNAGGAPPAPAATASPRFHRAIVALNLLAPLELAQHAWARMQAQPGGGLILNIGSIGGQRPSPQTAAYGAAKAALHHLTRSLAMEWAPHVRVNAVIPGLVATDDTMAHYGDEETRRHIAQTIASGRFVTPEEVADACLLLASPLARSLTGLLLNVDGGGELPAFLVLSQPPPSDRTPTGNTP